MNESVFFGQREGVGGDGYLITPPFVDVPSGGLDVINILDVYEHATGLSATTHRFGGSLLVRCPDRNHEDVHPSCLLRPDLGVWRCQACGSKGGKLDLIVAAGHASSRSQAREWLARASGVRGVVRPQPALRDRAGVRGARTVRAIHSYLDADGTVVEQCVRYRVNPLDGGREKSFDMRRPDGAGNWIYHHRAACDRSACACNGTGPLATTVPPILPYNLPAIVAAGKTGRTGILVEGEGDADALTAIGFTSCTNPYGVDFQYPMNWHRYFDAVPRWIVVCDSDAPGRKAAAERALFIGPSATIVDLFPDDTSEKHGRDVSDWRDMHHGTPEQQRESLLAIFRAALARATR